MMFDKKLHNNKKPYDHHVQVVLLGCHGVGKSTLIARALEEPLPDEIKPTISSKQTIAMIDLDKERIRLTLHDTVGERIATKNRYFSNNNHLSSQAAIVVVDATQQQMVEQLKQWDAYIKENYTHVKNKILVVNKRDIKKNDADTDRSLHRYAKEKGYRKVIYASAKENISVKTIFNSAAHCVVVENSFKEVLKERLKKHIYTIESLAGEGEYNKSVKKHDAVNESDKISINFACNFSFFKSSRADNREANYRLARKLLKLLEKDDNTIEAIFDDANIQFLRKTIIQKHALNTWYRGIHSDTLNGIIDDAQSMARSTIQCGM